MQKAPDTRGNYCDATHLCERLIPADSFYREFKELASPLYEIYRLLRGSPVH